MDSSHYEELSYSDAIDISPVNAWLLMGDDASYPTSSDISKMKSGDWALEWTGPSQAQRGDLLFFYFMSPMKEIRFVARVTGNPMYDADVAVNANKEISKHQWWIAHTPMLEVPPVTFKELNEEMGGNLILKGKPSHYLSPKVVLGLLGRMSSGDSSRTLGADASKVLQVPVGDPALPNPDEVDLLGWRKMSDGPLKLEAQVEEYVVNPLLRMVTACRSDLTVDRQQKIAGAGVPDYTISVAGEATCVVEAKTSIKVGRDTDWSESPDFQQVQKYMKALQVPGMLIDSKNIFLVEIGAAAPSRVVNRISATSADVEAIAAHVAG